MIIKKSIKKVCEVCKKDCADDYTYISAPVNSRIVTLCSKDAEEMIQTCKKFGIEFALY